MIKTDDYGTRVDGVKLRRTYSDENRYIQQEQTGAIYAEAIDVENSGYTYVETEEYLPQPIAQETDEETTEQEAIE